MADHGLSSAVKLASNESPFGPLPGRARGGGRGHGAARVATRTTWPDPARRHWPTATVSTRTTWPWAAVRSACCSSSLLSYAGPGDEVLFPWPSFIAYPQFTLAGRSLGRRGAADGIGWRTSTPLLAAATRRTTMVLHRQPEQPDQHGAADGRR